MKKTIIALAFLISTMATLKTVDSPKDGSTISIGASEELHINYNGAYYGPIPLLTNGIDLVKQGILMPLEVDESGKTPYFKGDRSFNPHGPYTFKFVPIKSGVVKLSFRTENPKDRKDIINKVTVNVSGHESF